MGYLTYFDLVESLIVSSYGGPQDAEQRDIRTAVQRAYSELTTINEWSHYVTHGRVITQEPYETGSVAFDSATNELTLTGGTWPAWAKYGSVSIGRLIAKVDSQTSATVLKLDPTLTFPNTLSAGQAYVLFRTEYPLPADFRNMDEPSNEFNWWAGLYLKPDEAMKLERVGNRSGRPWHWTIVKNPDAAGYVLKLVGYPTAKETLDFTYRRYPRAIKYSGHEPTVRISSVSVNEDSVVTWSAPNPAVPLAATGSIIRLGTGAAYPGPIESMTPYNVEAQITEIQGTRQVLAAGLAGFPPTTYSATAAIITDPADVARHMEAALYSCCDYWLARIRGVKADDAFATYQRDLRLAMEQDQLAPIAGRSRAIWHDGGWRSPLRADEGV